MSRFNACINSSTQPKNSPIARLVIALYCNISSDWVQRLVHSPAQSRLHKWVLFIILKLLLLLKQSFLKFLRFFRSRRRNKGFSESWLRIHVLQHLLIIKSILSWVSKNWAFWKQHWLWIALLHWHILVSHLALIQIFICLNSFFSRLRLGDRSIVVVRVVLSKLFSRKSIVKSSFILLGFLFSVTRWSSYKWSKCFWLNGSCTFWRIIHLVSKRNSLVFIWKTKLNLRRWRHLRVCLSIGSRILYSLFAKRSIFFSFSIVMTSFYWSIVQSIVVSVTNHSIRFWIWFPYNFI